MCGDMRISCQQPCETNNINSDIQDFEGLLDVLKDSIQFLISQVAGGNGAALVPDAVHGDYLTAFHEEPEYPCVECADVPQFKEPIAESL